MVLPYAARVSEKDESSAKNPRLPRRTADSALLAAMALLWVVDVLNSAATSQSNGPVSWWRLAPGVVAALAVLLPEDRVTLVRRALPVTVVSLAATALFFVHLRELAAGWGLLETLCLLFLLTRTAREEPPPRAAALCAALAAAVILAPFRLEQSGILAYSFGLTFLAGGAIGLGCYLRGLDARRRRAVADVRQSERLALARELHDFVAHHVTGIVVQAQAARTIRETAPEQIDPLLSGIEQAGSETLESMRKLVRVLREDDAAAVRPGELFTEVAELVAAFSERDAPATLHFEAAARQVRADPEVETSVRNVVREALTNVRRHAPGSPSVAVHVGLADPEADPQRLRVEVHNAPPAGHAPDAEPLGGRGGLGLVGLAERAEAVGGTLSAGQAPDDGWTLAAEFPVFRAVEGSPA